MKKSFEQLMEGEGEGFNKILNVEEHDISEGYLRLDEETRGKRSLRKVMD